MGGTLAVLAADVPAGLAPSGYLWSLLQMLGALAIVCVLAYVLLRGLRRLVERRGGAGGAVRVLERCPLSSRHSLWVVQVGGRCLLLGSSDAPGGPVTRLAELDGEALPSAAAAPTSPAPRSFRDLLGLRRPDRP